MHLNCRLPKYILAVLFFTVYGLSGCQKLHSTSQEKSFPVPAIHLKPHQYVIYKTAQSLTIDGKLIEDAWQQVRWTSNFVPITGGSSTVPSYQTRAKMLWDNHYLYIGIQLKETDLWATMTHRDSPLFAENACEILIDPDGDTQHYLEFGINALGTIYDLLLPKPYRDGGHPINTYNMLGIQAGVSLKGTLNDPSDTDTGWTVEVAFPLQALRELNMAGAQVPPKPGDQWRIQLARAEWPLTVSGHTYTAMNDPATGRPLPPTYTSWAPQGLVNLHYPEMWGFVQFSGNVAGQGHEAFNWHHHNEQIKWALRNVYYRQKQYYLNHHKYASDPSQLGLDQLDLNGLVFHQLSIPLHIRF